MASASGSGTNCDLCGKLFANLTYLKKHKKEVHSEINEEHSRCPKCQLKFNSLRNFWNHIITVHESQGVDLQGLPKIERIRREEVVEEENEERSSDCPQCGKQFPGLSLLLRHLNNVHLHTDAELAIKCVRCCVEFEDEETLDNHIKEVHEKSIIDMLAFPCNRCQIKFYSVDGLWRHKTKVHDLDMKIDIPPIPVTCQYCSQVISGDYSAHYKDFHAEQTPKCEECGKTFCDMKSLRRHKNTVHSTIRPNSCHLCEKSFKKISHLQRHLSVHSKETLEPNLKCLMKEIFGYVCNKTFTCGICKVKVNSSAEAKIHVYIKHPETFQKFMQRKNAGVSCLYCAESFVTKELVIAHIKVNHPEGQIPTCHICGHQELKERDVNFHFKECHSQEARWACELCNITFNNKRERGFHMSRMHGSNAQECPYCQEKHVKVKLHVTVKHPEHAVEYSKLVADAIRGEALARKKFNEFLDPDWRRKGVKRKWKSSDEDDTDSEVGDEVEEGKTEDKDYTIQNTVPHLIQVHRKQKDTAIEELNENNQTDEHNSHDMKPSIN